VSAGAHRPGTIVVLAGASSSGKTSLAHKLQSLSERHWLWVTTDHFWPMLPPRFDPLDEVRLRSALSRAFLLSLLELSGAGWDVVADAVVLHPVFRSLCSGLLADAPAHLVAVRCSLEELERRELARGDRSVGLARSQVEQGVDNGEFDLAVDTTAASPEACARTVLDYLSRAPEPTAFRRMRARAPSSRALS
jgi:chloramphenicol 3-O phosphotransferase